ncbi:MAG TPA: lytic murein transglycosylase [Candidatus Paceibacterota bacterium]|nr:lytic murein transglycosylase [Candidatus Paceibacterota bacterium]
MKYMAALIFAACFLLPHVAQAGTAARPLKARVRMASLEAKRMIELERKLCKEKGIDCGEVESIFSDPRLVIHEPPPPTPPPTPGKPPRGNPYLSVHFGLLTDVSLERCATFYAAHAKAFALALANYGVPKEPICGILRIETNFGMPAGKTKRPLGSRPAINALVSLYVRRTTGKRQKFAFEQIKALLRIVNTLGPGSVLGKELGRKPDIFDVPGSVTGAIGLMQFEPSSFGAARDGNGDGVIDPFDSDDAIVSIAHYLVTRGWDGNRRHEERAVWLYYGTGDRHKYYPTAVFKYAAAAQQYFVNHPPTQKSAI